jgi:hypothetical protein
MSDLSFPNSSNGPLIFNVAAVTSPNGEIVERGVTLQLMTSAIAVAFLRGSRSKLIWLSTEAHDQDGARQTKAERVGDQDRLTTSTLSIAETSTIQRDNHHLTVY